MPAKHSKVLPWYAVSGGRYFCLKCVGSGCSRPLETTNPKNPKPATFQTKIARPRPTLWCSHVGMSPSALLLDEYLGMQLIYENICILYTFSLATNCQALFSRIGAYHACSAVIFSNHRQVAWHNNTHIPQNNNTELNIALRVASYKPYHDT